MTSADSSKNPGEMLQAALDDFRAAWFSGKPVDVETFLADHPSCGSGLRDEIEGFLLVAEGLPKVDRGSSLEEDDQSKILGDFKIIREIGRGGMATVYEAQQISLRRKVALKLLPSHLSFSRDAVRKFQREAEAGGRQSHPGIVAVFAVGEYEGQHFIAQDLIEGGYTLEDKIEEILEGKGQRQGYFHFVSDLILKVTDALHYAHESGVIHRDIKPSNILLTRQGSPKVTDFGLAKIEDALALTRTGDFSGTPYYMSPEQAASRRFGIDRRTDIFSLGVTLYEMLTLKLPFEGDTSQEVLKKVLLIDPSDPHRMNPKVPRDLSAICLKAMEKLPDRRYQTMEAFGDDLNRFLHGDVVLATLAGPGSRFWRRIKRNPVVSAAMSTALLAVLVLIGYVLWSYPQIKKERDIAELEKKRALAAEEEADLQRKVAEDRYKQITRLSDVVDLADLEAEADALWPAFPENIPMLRDWITRAQKLIDRSNNHYRTLATLRMKALPLEDGTYRFEDKETRWQYKTLVGLVEGLARLSDGQRGSLKSVKERLVFAQMLEDKSVDHREAWNQAIHSVADRVDCPGYDGLDMQQQTGFLPIGRDPESGLWGVVHLQTGNAPKRDDNGKLLLTEEMGLVFVLVPGGTFNIGATTPSEECSLGTPNVDPAALSNEKPVHAVTLNSFFISKYEMTQGQWLRFTGYNPSIYGPHHFRLDWSSRNEPMTLLHPVEMVSWEDCAAVLDRLGLRLPSEQEWEYAARAGTSTIWWTGNDRESLKGAANLCDLTHMKKVNNPRLCYDEWLNDGYVYHAEVGRFLPNAFGLHDVYGNEMEWCQDGYYTYRSSFMDDIGSESPDSKNKILRGGCWFTDASFCRSACRSCRFDPRSCYNYVGLRPACSLP